MKFTNDITPVDLGFMRDGDIPVWLICYTKEKPHVPFIVEVIDTDRLGWHRGIAYEVNGNGNFFYEWPKNWYWSEWIHTKYQ